MRASALATLVGRDLARARASLAGAAFGIGAGTSALVFFAALALGVRAVLFGDVFPLDRVELEPKAGPEPGLLSVLLGGGSPPPGIEAAAIERVAAAPGVVRVYPKLRAALPAAAFGGKEIVGREIGTHEVPLEGLDPALVEGELKGPLSFRDPLAAGGPACQADAECGGARYCERPSGEAAGRCSDPVPVLVSRYLVELFNKGIAPAHGYPPVAASLLARAEGVTFRIELGASMLGRAAKGAPRAVKARIVGVSPNAIDLGLTLPLGVVERWNREYAGEAAASRRSSLLVRVASADRVAPLVEAAAREGLAPKDERARDLSAMVNGVAALLGLVSLVMLVVASTNIAFTFRALVAERRPEIGLYRALGATPGDVRAWLLSLALAVGAGAGALGAAVARAAAWAADRAAASSLPDFPFKPETFFRFSPSLYLGGAAFGALFAVAGALWAVRRAARLDPARALLGS
ncbi:MAG TPA: ABC transporter permease [Polyangiaceae bacterium]|nr:ABC transporter permease [Polyangiaceae bacterium]